MERCQEQHASSIVLLLCSVTERADEQFCNAIPHDAAIRAFFQRYEDRFNRSLGENGAVDKQGVIDSFADYFVGAGPAGVKGAKNGLVFRFMIPRGFAIYRKIGTTSMKITRIDITALDDMHAMAKVHWDSRYLRKDGADVRIEFDNIYMLQVRDDRPKIFAYVTGDEQKVLNEHGLV